MARTCSVATTACTFSTSEPPKVARTCSVLYILTSKCASRHNGVHFFDISTSKSGPKLVCFVHFDLEMCFAPQRRALFDIATSKSGPKLVCFVHFDFKMCFAQNVQNTPVSDHFWKLRCRKSARRCGAKHISKSKVLKTGGLGPLLEVEMSKKCTFPSQNVQNTPAPDHFWKLRCRKSVRRCSAKHISK